MRLLPHLNRLFTSICIGLIVCGTASQIGAQSSLFNIPTTDTLSKGETYIEADFDAHLSGYRNGGWQSFGVLGVRGVSNRVEVGLNAYTTRTADGFGSPELQPNFKVKFYENESLGITAATGAVAYLPLNRSLEDNALVSTYAVVSKKFKKEWTPKLTAGAYQLIGRNPDSADMRGLLLAVEQPVHKRVSFIADWSTGKNRFGYAAAGVGVTLSSRSYLYSAYYFGNEARSNNSLGIYYGYVF